MKTIANVVLGLAWMSLAIYVFNKTEDLRWLGVLASMAVPHSIAVLLTRKV